MIKSHVSAREQTYFLELLLKFCHEDLAVVDYATYTEMKSAHDEAIAEKSKKVQEMKGQMEQVEMSLGAAPPGIGASGASTKQIRGNLSPVVNLSVAAPAAAVALDSTNNHPGHIRASDLQFNPYEVFETSANNVLQGMSDTVKRDLSGLMKEFGVGGQEDKEIQKKRQKITDLREAELHARAVGDPPDHIAQFKRLRQKLENELLLEDN
jgi:hypothetical protein